MDCNSRTPSWDLTDMVNGSTNSGGQGYKVNFSIDLKLGSVSNSGEKSRYELTNVGASRVASSPSGSSKRARAASKLRAASCLVDGCTSDLRDCREYHRRHKVCELHSKTPQVMIGSLTQRFCQQCSRFHALDEFDEGKRSCRKRLDGHNRRRRKPQPQPLPSRSFESNYQGTGLTAFSSSSHTYPTVPVMSTAPARAKSVSSLEGIGICIKQLENFHDKPTSFPGSFSSSQKGAKTVTFPRGDNLRHISHSDLLSASDHSPLVKSLTFSQGGGGGIGHKILYEADCALSLLSSPLTHPTGISLGNIVQPDSIHSTEPVMRNLHRNTVEDSFLVPGASDTDADCPSILHLGSDWSSGNEAPRTFPFDWD